jgi:hypothetical protein
MNSPEPKVRRLDDADASTLMAAFEVYIDTGQCSVVCDRCRMLIKFVKLSESAWRHHCACGKYNGNFRGL